MRLLLLAPTPFEIASVAEELSANGLDVYASALNDASSRSKPAAADRVALILPGVSFGAIGEQVAEVRAGLGPGVPLLLCCPQLTHRDRAVVTACGATTIVSPRTWSEPAAVAERLLGEFILDGSVTPQRCGDLWGGTAGMRELYRQIETIAPLAETVLVTGETGTGKERVAQEIHRLSRRPGALMAVNSAEFTPELLASELFGHARGAFSGAVERRKGLLVAAGESTFFLDEIGDLTPAAQAKLLRMLEERKVRPVGSNDWEPMRARLVLATRRDLESAPEESFRRDLYERIRGFMLRVPPLRRRRADLPLLVHHFVHEYDREYSGDRHVPAGVVDPLFRYSWPGNVRELRAAVRQAAAYAAGNSGPISALHLLSAAQRSIAADDDRTLRFDPARESWRQVHDRVRSLYFRSVLAEAGGNKELAAERAGLSRSQLYEILRHLDDGSSAS